MRFPIVPAINNVVIRRLIFFLMKSQINAQTPMILIAIIIKKGTGNDRDIPVFNIGKTRDEWFR